MSILMTLLMLGPINLEDLECFDTSALYVHALEEGRSLWSCSSEHLLVILDKDGDVLHHYKKKGKGPDVIEYPSVLGITLERIFINSDKRVQTFDHQLRLVENSLPPLNIRNLGGEYLGDNHFYLNPPFHDKIGIRIITPGTDEWQITSSFLATPWEFPEQPTTTVMYRHTVRGANGYFYYGRDVDKIKIRGDYQIEVYQKAKGQEPEMIQMLTSRLDGFPEWGLGKAFASEAIRVGDHYVVRVGFAKFNPYQALATYLDFYNELGKLIHRQKFQGSHFMMPIHGKLDGYLIDNDELIATPISSYLEKFKKKRRWLLIKILNLTMPRPVVGGDPLL